MIGCGGDSSELSEGLTAATSPGPGDGEVVNTLCPITGEAVDPSLTTEWNGYTVGFCCPDCPAKREALTDEQKVEKLAEAEAKAKGDDPGAPG